MSRSKSQSSNKTSSRGIVLVLIGIAISILAHPISFVALMIAMIGTMDLAGWETNDAAMIGIPRITYRLIFPLFVAFVCVIAIPLVLWLYHRGRLRSSAIVATGCIVWLLVAIIVNLYIRNWQLESITLGSLLYCVYIYGTPVFTCFLAFALWTKRFVLPSSPIELIKGDGIE